MTKNILLAAAAVGAMAFAGAATAGSITGGAISGVNITSGAGATLKVVPYTVATEADMAAAGISTTTNGVNVVVGLDSPVNLAAGAKVPFAVTYTLTGPATFEGTLTQANLVAPNGATAATGLVVMSADKKSVTFHIEFQGGAGGSNVDALTLSGATLKVTGEQDVSIASEARVTVAGFTQTVGTQAAAKIIAFKPVLASFKATNYAVTAMLPNFKTFGAQGANATGGVATAGTVTSNRLGLDVNADVYGNLTGGAPLTLANVIASATATVKGPQVKSLQAALGTADGTAANTEAKFTLTAAQLTSGQLVLAQPATAVAADAGSYTAEIKPVFASGFSGNADATLNLVTIGLDGTNFFAPWFALDNGTANSTLRLANNGSSAVGPIVISLKANNGAAAPTGTYTIPSIAPGTFASVRGDQLKTAFGTTAGNGDLMITIQSQANSVSAKIRTSQSTGQIFENSLDVLRDPSATEAQVKAIQTTLDNW